MDARCIPRVAKKGMDRKQVDYESVRHVIDSYARAKLLRAPPSRVNTRRNLDEHGAGLAESGCLVGPLKPSRNNNTCN